MRLTASETPRLDAEVLLAEVLQKPRSYLYTWPERELSQAQQDQFEVLLQRREQGQPIAYILGQREFWSLALRCNESTLIPRPETERLVEIALELALPERARVLDLGTGTGAIALALKSERPDWHICAVDKQQAAIALAQANADNLQLEVDFKVSDWFQNVGTELFDLIVSNPPYIAADDPHLQQGDVRFEPHSALIAPDQGLADIKQISTNALAYLKPTGWLLFEHGYEQAAVVQQVLRQHAYQEIQTWTDYANLERITGARKG
ncbi:peptide chain release factor N(5)-glutamine methyltransferase [Pseudidiomarina taiwanensis]|uniref:Release factor glutamine methyltransferase n=2 Tax=Pseudidiomarina taiwanensis TaxID=337250 RepID=A0A432ZP63_9GAMM|nr:peptide chain release factor N(5)-glutamine methyltransferase [Pseudidiomarina taiwanensis]